MIISAKHASPTPALSRSADNCKIYTVNCTTIISSLIELFWEVSGADLRWL